MFISPAFAEAVTGATTTAAESPSFLVSMAPLLVIFVIFYFMVIRPQNKRIIEHRKMITELKKGDKIVTGGGLIGTVKKVTEGSDEVVIEIASGVEVTALRSTIMTQRTTPVAKA